MTKEQEEAINYFSGYEEGDNITITCDFLDYAEKIINALKSKDRAIDLMTEEIADLQKSVEQIYDDYQDIGKMAFDYSDKIEEQEKIIDKLKKHNDELLRKLKNRVKQVKKLEKYSTYKSEFSRLNKKIKEQDEELQMLKDFEEIANSKVTDLNPIRISKNKSIAK